MSASWIVFISLALLFLIVSYANSKTPKPESSRDVVAECGGCHNMMCGNKMKAKYEEWVDEQKAKDKESK